LDQDDDRPVDGVVEMNATRDGDISPKEHQDVYVESKGHGQHGTQEHLAVPIYYLSAHHRCSQNPPQGIDKMAGPQRFELGTDRATTHSLPHLPFGLRNASFPNMNYEVRELIMLTLRAYRD
jgi:hypothetical protein